MKNRERERERERERKKGGNKKDKMHRVVRKDERE